MLISCHVLQPKVKTKANMRLHEDTTLDRLKPIGLELYDITLPRAQMEVTVSRDFMASVYGGSMQATRPKIGKEKLATHPFRNFVYLHMDYQPHAPQVPGAPGLFIGTRVGTDWEGPQKVFVRLASNTYQYEGEYDVRYSTPFTLAEWTNQKYEVYFPAAWLNLFKFNLTIHRSKELGLPKSASRNGELMFVFACKRVKKEGGEIRQRND